jgi:predicted DNA-binding protein (MmcQ/YjbR family)
VTRIHRVRLAGACAFAPSCVVVKASAKVCDRLLQLGLSYPEAWEDHPWDETVVKVRKKIFVFLGIYDQHLTCTVKLPDSRDFALSFDWTEPTGYGLGRAGWVSARFPLRSDVPVDLLEEWIDESYRAVAPKTLVKQLDT